MKEFMFLAVVAVIGYAIYKPKPEPSGSPNDQIFHHERAKRQAYSETADIQACSESSANCYSLTADLEHQFDSGDQETVYVHRIHFPNRGWLDFNGATIPGTGVDKNDNTWNFGW